MSHSSILVLQPSIQYICILVHITWVYFSWCQHSKWDEKETTIGGSLWSHMNNAPNNSRVWTTFGHKGSVADLHTMKISRWSICMSMWMFWSQRKWIGLHKMNFQNEVVAISLVSLSFNIFWSIEWIWSSWLLWVEVAYIEITCFHLFSLSSNWPNNMVLNWKCIGPFNYSCIFCPFQWTKKNVLFSVICRLWYNVT